MPTSRWPGLPKTISDPHAVGFCLALLGGFSVWLGDQEVPENSFERRKTRHLLKLLALQPEHRLHRDQIMDLLWPDLDPRSAAAQLYKAMYRIEFWNPTNPTEKQTLPANNRWGVGITTASIEKAISNRYGRVISYDISVCAAFSTGYLGLQGSVTGALFPLGGLERVIIYDCLYGTLKPALDRVKAVKGSAHIIVYVVTEGGNSFQKDQAASFDTLVLGRIPTWNYINLMGNVGFHAVASARLVSEARSPTARILDPLPAAYETALNELVAKLPPRNLLVSNEALFRKVKGSLQTGATVLATFAADKANGAAIRDFFRQVNTTRHCIGRAQLLGWPAPPGEEWHDLLLVEFAWEYLT